MFEIRKTGVLKDAGFSSLLPPGFIFRETGISARIAKVINNNELK
jgi:hypothetical protein